LELLFYDQNTDQPSANNDEIDPNFDMHVSATEGHPFEHTCNSVYDQSLHPVPVPSDQPNPMLHEQPLHAIITESLEFRSYRRSLIDNTLEIPLETKIRLRRALGDDWWHWSLRTYENFMVDPLPSRWPVEDDQALLLIRRVHPIPIETIATTFFPMRLVDEVKHRWDKIMAMYPEWNETDNDLLA
jgi:hypothetical protein